MGQRIASVKIFQWIFQNKIKHMLLVIFLDALRTVFLTMIISKPKIEMHYHIWKYYTDSDLQVLNKFPVDLKGKAWSFSTLLHGWLPQWLFCLFIHLLFIFLLIPEHIMLQDDINLTWERRSKEQNTYKPTKKTKIKGQGTKQIGTENRRTYTMKYR